MKDQSRNRLIASGVVAVVYGVAWTIDAIVEHKKRKEQKQYDDEFRNIVQNF